MISIDFSNIQLNLKKDDSKTYVFDEIRRKWLVLTPEEYVRQYFIKYIVSQGYSASKIAVEKAIRVNNLTKRFDIVVFDGNHEPLIIVECKAPEVNIDDKVLSQLLSYHSVLKCKYWVLTNGVSTYCADAGDIANIQWLTLFPANNF